jgi:hypothetical protein
MAVVRIAAQFAAYAAFAAVIGYFSAAPAYTYFPPDMALLKLSLVHGGSRQAECRRRTAEELAKLPPNMRRPMDCPRVRPPIVVEIDLDGRPLYRGTHQPTGLSGDGPSRVYERFVVPPGEHRLAMRLRDTARAAGFDHEGKAVVRLAARQSVAIDFRPEAGGFVLK